MTSKTLMASEEQREVSNSANFKEVMTKVNDASIGVVLIRSREPYRVQEVLQEWCAESEMDFKVWTILTGWQTFPSPTDDNYGEVDFTSPQSTDSVFDPLKAFDEIQKMGDNLCAVFMNPQHVFEMPGFQQHIKAHVRRSLDTRQRVILLVPEAATIPANLEDDIHIVEFHTPSHMELKQMWDAMVEGIDDSVTPDFDEDDINLIIQNALGMSHPEFDTALAIAFVEYRENIKSKVTPEDFIKVLMNFKVEVIKKTHILELQEEAHMTDVGGLDLLKEWVQERSLAFSQEARDFGIDLPRGVLIVGPPGGGKSLTAKAIASELNVPCISFDIGKVFGQYIGQSETQMRKALKMTESMAPCVLMVDEVDKGLGGIGGGGDSGTTSRVFGTFLTWMQERHADEMPIFIVMTANNVIGLPPELMRRGRLDEIFAVTFPSADERKEIMKIHLKKRGHDKDLTDEELTRIAKATKDFVGAELESIVKDSLIKAYKEKLKKTTVELMIAEAEKIIPISKAFADKVKFMNNWAKDNARAASSTMTFESPPSSKAKIKRIGGKKRTGKTKPSRSTTDN